MDDSANECSARGAPFCSAAVAASAAMVASTLLVACGGAPEPVQRMLTEMPEDRPGLLGPSAVASGGRRARNLSASRTPSPDQFFAFIQAAYPGYFPDDPPTQRVENPPALMAIAGAPMLSYRIYANGNVVGVMGGQVLAISPLLTGGALVRVGALSDFGIAARGPLGPDTDEAAVRFLTQATFGATDADMAELRARGFADWLDTQMTLPRGERAWDWMQANGYAAIDERALYDAGHFTAEAALAKEAAEATDPVRQRMALALSEFFVVSGFVAQMPWTGMGMAHYWDQLQDHTFGNFRDLLEAMTLNPTMGAWLNTRGNLKEDTAVGRVPDENYAREVMQLFTIGLVQLNLDGTPRRDASGQPLSTYTQTDVTQLARIFTGWDWWDDGRRFFVPLTGNDRPYPEFTRRAMVFHPARHSTLESTVLGTRIPSGADGVARLHAALDILFRHPNVGPFFGRQMIQRLVTGDPSPAYVARVASAFNDNGNGVRGDLKAVWRAILLDDEARGAASLSSPTHGKVREPMVRILQWLRSFGARSRGGRWGYWPVGHSDVRTGYDQRAFASPSVFNWFRPGYVPPGTAMGEAAATAPEFQIINESTVSQWINAIDTVNLLATDAQAFGWFDWDVGLQTERALAHDPAALVRRLNLLLAAGQISAASEARLAEMLQLATWMPQDPTDPAAASARRWRAIAAITLVMSSVEYIVQK